MSVIHIPGPVGQVGDGHHTFEELYEDRNTLFLVLMNHHPLSSWVSTLDHHGKGEPDFFNAGLDLKTGPVSYRLPARLWSIALCTRCRVLDRAPTPGPTNDNLGRLVRSITGQCEPQDLGPIGSITEDQSVKIRVDGPS